MTLTRKTLATTLTMHGFTARKAETLVDSVFDVLTDQFAKGEDVQIQGFGHFLIRRKVSRRGRNPHTGEPLEISARCVLNFKPSKILKQRIIATRTSAARAV